MAPIARRVEKENRADSILVFARELDDILGQGLCPPHQKARLLREIERVGLISNAAAANKKVELDKEGTRLWNRASKLKVDPRLNVEYDAELLCRVRVFACLLLDCAGRGIHGSPTNEIRILKTALKTSKNCLEERQLALAETVVERAAFYDEKLLEAPQNHENITKSLSIQYKVVRIALAWRQDRLDLAKLMLVKLVPAKNDIDASQAEELSDLLFEIGKDLTKKALWSDALPWLEAAFDGLAEHSPESMSGDAGELRMSIMHSMVKSFSHCGGDDNRRKAWNIIRQMSTEYGDKLMVLLLRLDLVAADPFPSAEDYRDTLRRVASTVHLTDSNVSTILHHVHKLRTWDSRMAHAALVGFLADRLSEGEHQAWLEKTLITIIWNCTSSPDFPDALSTITGVFADVLESSSKALSPSATHAAQILLWKRIEAVYNQEMYQEADSWCRLSLHDIFSNSGSMNIGKIQRKLILCALGMSNATKAREIASAMSAANQSEPSTQYLLYKVAQRCQDLEMAAQCLKAICSTSAKDATVLYACVLEAQRVGDQAQTIVAMQSVLEQFNYSAPSGVHLPALLRCNVRLLMRSIDTATEDDSSTLCKLFEGAATQAKLSRRQEQDNLFTLVELDWFSRNSYNLALKICTTWPPAQTLRLVQSASRLIDLYPADLDPSLQADLSLRTLFCSFLATSLYTVLARNEDTTATQLQHYLSARKSVSTWRTHLPPQLTRLESGARADLLAKHATLLAFDFEATARLKAWDSFDPIIEECEQCADAKIYAVLADITLACEAPTAVVIRTLQQIINVTWQAEGNDVQKLSRWIRCLVSIALVSDAGMVETLLERVVAIVENAAKMGEGRQGYPAEELEWLAATTFNRAIDFYCSGLDRECRRWAERALQLANLCRDGGVLHGVLQGKFGGLVWEGR